MGFLVCNTGKVKNVPVCHKLHNFTSCELTSGWQKWVSFLGIVFDQIETLTHRAYRRQYAIHPSSEHFSVGGRRVQIMQMNAGIIKNMCDNFQIVPWAQKLIFPGKASNGK
jgi:hypothetical protein